MELDYSWEGAAGFGGGGFVLVWWVGVEDVDEEISVLNSDHCFEGFIF